MFPATALMLAVLSTDSVGEAAVAHEEAPEAAQIRDNLFMLEEAYNQEPGVVQHIQSYVYQPRDHSWAWSFTEEWPVPSDLHQLSVTVQMASGDAGRPAIGDLLVNYRLQAVGLGGKGRLFMAPRLSLVLPTGDYRTGAGRGVIGVQLNLPATIELSRSFVAHLNAGLTFTPSARSPAGRSDDALDTNLGAALVFQPFSWGNALVEVAHLTTVGVGDEASERRSVVLVNPGLRFAIDIGRLQIVPGVSAPIQLSSEGVEVGALAYLSFEHPLWNP